MPANNSQAGELYRRADLLGGETLVPGKWGLRFCRVSAWSASLDRNYLKAGDRVIPVASIAAVSLNRGLFWGKIKIHLQNDDLISLDGLKNRVAEQLAGGITATCILNSIERLKQLEGLALKLREKWSALLDTGHWFPQSEVTRFVSSCPANDSKGALRGFLARAFTAEAIRYLNSEQAELLAFLGGQNLAELARQRNEAFLANAVARYKAFFDSVEKNPLTDEQRRAVVTFDDNVMAVAAAGSGKTSVMVAKAGYAVTAGLFEPEQILMLAFNQKAAQELSERVSSCLSRAIYGADQIRVATFHSIGLEIIGQATGSKPRLAPWVENGNEQSQLEKIVEALGGNSSFARKWQLFKSVFARSLPPIGAESEPESWDPETKRQGFRTLRGDLVKSHEERMICDWLASEGIEYSYEREYQYPTATATHSQYQPDFFYPSANLYHEHFALDKNGAPPPHFVGYLEGVTWKRELHQERGTTLIETTSHGIRSEYGFDKLEKELRAHGVKFDETPLTEAQLESMPEDAKVLRVFRTFLSHVKSNRQTMEQLRARLRSKDSEHPFKHRLFLDIFEMLWREWDRCLADGGYVDFDDMLLQAVDHLAAGRCTPPYKLVMADEFQDASRARGELLRQLTKNRDSRLFVVGDDWQAINRFAGADISLMREFGTFFGGHTVVKLTKTFRCPSDLCELAGRFVMANPHQIEKTVVSTSRRRSPSVLCFKLKDIETQGALLREHLGKVAAKLRREGVDEPLTALVLGRYHFNRPSEMPLLRDEIEDVLDLRFSTVHAAKGLEADYVFLLNVVEGLYGFPSKIEDDSTLWVAMPKGEEFPFAEERRLFYVALTRAKRFVTIYTGVSCRSEFIAELEAMKCHLHVREQDVGPNESRDCPKCQTGVLVVRTSKYGDFLSCARFPKCNYKENIHRRGRHPIRGQVVR